MSCTLLDAHVLNKCNHKQEGFLPDVVRLLEKYQQIDILYTYIERGTFPTSFAWKRVNCITVQFLLGTVEH